jgi:hypothetical protein
MNGKQQVLRFRKNHCAQIAFSIRGWYKSLQRIAKPVAEQHLIEIDKKRPSCCNLLFFAGTLSANGSERSNFPG